MNVAKYYIYRNLHTKGFSIRYRGLVIDRLMTFSADGVIFKVNELGRQRVIQEKKKNVHAFVVADKYTKEEYPFLSFGEVDALHKISYNPYLDTHFVCNGKRIDFAQKIVFQNGRCFLLE
jgi:hypothetical protein